MLQVKLECTKETVEQGIRGAFAIIRQANPDALASAPEKLENPTDMLTAVMAIGLMTDATSKDVALLAFWLGQKYPNA